MDLLGPGRIFWAVYPGSRGDGKKRPMVVVTRRTEIMKTRLLTAVVCSTRFDVRSLLPCEVPLPYGPPGTCATRLVEPRVAVCDWKAYFGADDIELGGGLVSSPILREICRSAGIPYPWERG